MFTIFFRQNRRTFLIVDDRVGATIVIQSFVTNLHGSLDNLAWIWVYETSQRGPGGNELDRRLVGLSEGYWFLRKSFSKSFIKYLKSRRKWFRHVVEFRDFFGSQDTLVHFAVCSLQRQIR